MEHNAINPSEVATLSLLGNTSYGYGHRNDYLHGSALADGTANHAKLDSIESQLNLQNEQTRDLMRDRQFNDMQLQIGDFKTEMTRLSGDQRVELQTKVDAVLAKIGECCCETQKEILREGNSTRELINARALDDTQRALDSAERNNGTNQILAAMQAQTAALVTALTQNNHGHGGRSLAS